MVYDVENVYEFHINFEKITAVHWSGICLRIFVEMIAV